MTNKIAPEIAKREQAELVALQLRLAELSVQAKRLADASGLSRREIARRMGNLSTSNLQRLLGGMARSASVETLARFAWACGHELNVSFARKSSEPKDQAAGIRERAEEAARRAAGARSAECCQVLDFCAYHRARAEAEYVEHGTAWRTDVCAVEGGAYGPS